MSAADHTPAPQADGTGLDALVKEAIDAVWKCSLIIESSVRRGDGPMQYAEVLYALSLVKEVRAALAATVENSGHTAPAASPAPQADVMARAIEIICREAEDMGFPEDTIAEFRAGQFDGDDLLTLQAVERALDAAPSPRPHLEASIRRAGLEARDDLLERMADGGTVDNDLADYMERIVDACVRAALAATEGK